MTTEARIDINEQYALGVDAFVSEPALRAFEQRQAAVQETVDYYLDKTKRPFIVMGGGALALHGIDTYAYGLVNQKPFDVDAIEFEEPGQGGMVGTAARKLFVPGVKKYHDAKAPLDLTIIRANKAAQFAYGEFRYPSYDALVQSKIKIGSTWTLPLPKMIENKAAMGRPKDDAGLIKAHVVAHALDHPIVGQRYWSEAVGAAVQRLRSEGDVSRYARTRPRWLDELVQIDFDHPAYRTLPNWP